MEILVSAMGSNILAIIILSLLILLIRRNPILTKERSYAYYVLMIAILVVVFFETCVVIIRPIYYTTYMIFYSLSFTLTPFVPLFFAKVICPPFVNLKNKRFFIPFLLHFLIAVTNPLTGWYFSLAPNNTIIFGALFGLFFIFLCYSYCLLYYASFKSAKERAKADRLYFFIPATVALSCTLIQLFVPFFLLGWCGLSIGMFYYYTFMRELQHRYDPLTGVMNRMSFQDMMEKLKNHNSVTIAVFDLNRLKQINDNYGHSEGDKTISDMANIIQECFDGIGTLYRIGGDEFCLIAEKADKDSIEAAFTRVDERVAVQPDVHDVPFSLAYGYAEYGKESSGTIYDCFDSADSMMYLNKRFIKGEEQRRKSD